MKKTTAVIVGKFQCPELTQAHIDLLRYAEGKYDNLIVIIGSNQIRTEISLYSAYTRANMIRQVLRDGNAATFLDIVDVFNKEIWSEKLDELIYSHNPEGYDVVLCGGRDSFLKHYVGFYNKFDDFKSIYGESVSATEMRKQVFQDGPIDDPLFRKGQLFEALSAYPTAYQTVDAAIIDGEGCILLGRKKNEKKFCLIGGFSEPTSESLEADVIKEVYEEATITVEMKDIKYVGSKLVNDPRRFESKHKNKTALFTVKVVRDVKFKHGDDIVQCKWFSLDDINRDVLVERHIPILEMYMERRGFFMKVKEFVRKLTNSFIFNRGMYRMDGM